MNLQHALRSTAVLAVALALASCASRTPNAIYLAPLAVTIVQGDQVNTTVTTMDGRMPEAECKMLASRITDKVRTLAPLGAGAFRSYELAVNITRYARGNGLVRTLVIGTGQIHLDGVVTVYQMPKRVKVGEFILNKAYAMGGLYGVSVNMNTISNTYAQAVAETVCRLK